jgi:hypothetical protein
MEQNHALTTAEDASHQTAPDLVRKAHAAVIAAAPANLLVSIHSLGRAVFGDDAPSVRTLREMVRKRQIPVFRIGWLHRFDPRLVRAALELHCLVQAKQKGAVRHEV